MSKAKNGSTKIIHNVHREYGSEFEIQKKKKFKKGKCQKFLFPWRSQDKERWIINLNTLLENNLK
jgi:hypothetical protein